MMARRHLDFYETNDAAVEALYNHYLRYYFGREIRIYEPCVGAGAITNALAKRGFGGFVTNDIGPAHAADFHEDAATFVPKVPFDLVISNPPFNRAFEILKNLRACGYPVAFLLRLTFLEPTKARGAWLRDNPPDGMIVLPRYSFTGDGKVDSVTCAWMVWGSDADFGIELAPAEKE